MIRSLFVPIARSAHPPGRREVPRAGHPVHGARGRDPPRPSAARPSHSLGLDRIDRPLYASGRIDCNVSDPAEVQPHLDRIPRGAGHVRHDGRLSPGQGVDEARLSRIRCARDDDPRTFPHPLPPPSSRCRSRSSRNPQPTASSSQRGKTGSRGSSSSSAKSSSASISAPPRPDQALPPSLIEITQSRRRSAAKSLTPLRLRFRGNEIGKALDLRQVKTRRLRKARRVNSPGSAGRKPPISPSVSKQGRDDGASTMNLQFGNIFPGETSVWPRKKKDEAWSRAPLLCLPLINLKEALRGSGAEFEQRFESPNLGMWGPLRRTTATPAGRRPRWTTQRSYRRFSILHSFSSTHRKGGNSACLHIGTKGSPMPWATGTTRQMTENLLRHEASPYLLLASGQSCALASMGTLGALEEAQRLNKPHPSVGRLCSLSLVSRHGT